MPAMADQGERYDRIAHGYAMWWGPVLESRALGVLDLLDGEVGPEAFDLLDVGTGTGVLALAAIRRWPGSRVVAIDASDGMLAAAEAEAGRRLRRDERARIRFERALADRLPLPDRSMDAVISSFVLQLVPSRIRALRELARVLRPDGRLAYVTWLRSDRPWAPDAILDEALDEAGFGPREESGRPGDVASPSAAAVQLRRAGFADVRAWAAWLEHPFTPEGYLGFVEEFDEEDTFASMDQRTRDRTRRRILDGVAALPRDERTLRLPVVYATGRRRA